MACLFMIRPYRYIPLLSTCVLIGLFSVWLSYGTLEPCGILRTKLRIEMRRAATVGALMSRVMPDTYFDVVIAKKYGHLTQGACLSLLFDPKKRLLTPSLPPTQKK